jgi:hypothetical protein
LFLTLIDGFGFGNWLREPLPETIGDSVHVPARIVFRQIPGAKS